ncbi:hypothetical protein PMIN01_06559 [Paraphaeosphaeria minitans]|uniref:Uncharacterized protein n=1 Tax=Paraphaeosphaeria minitans TaxID=565426 RepID=A0A9P6GJ67_9PLEO|nr:hypothetical protein PMIN01_06559 [Paraphaeosphaeria minitans]
MPPPPGSISLPWMLFVQGVVEGVVEGVCWSQKRWRVAASVLMSSRSFRADVKRAGSVQRLPSGLGGNGGGEVSVGVAEERMEGGWTGQKAQGVCTVRRVLFGRECGRGLGKQWEQWEQSCTSCSDRGEKADREEVRERPAAASIRRWSSGGGCVELGCMRAQSKEPPAAPNQSPPGGPASCGVKAGWASFFVASGSWSGTRSLLHASRCPLSTARQAGPWLHAVVRSAWRETAHQYCEQCAARGAACDVRAAVTVRWRVTVDGGREMLGGGRWKLDGKCWAVDGGSWTGKARRSTLDARHSTAGRCERRASSVPWHTALHASTRPVSLPLRATCTWMHMDGHVRSATHASASARTRDHETSCNLQVGKPARQGLLISLGSAAVRPFPQRMHANCEVPPLGSDRRSFFVR